MTYKFLIIILIILLFVCYLKYLNNNLDKNIKWYHEVLTKKNEKVPVRYAFGGKSMDYPEEYIKKVLMAYYKTKDKNHLLFLAKSIALGESGYYVFFLFAYMIFLIFFIVEF